MGTPAGGWRVHSSVRHDRRRGGDRVTARVACLGARARRRLRDADVRVWTAIGAVFLLWSLGTHVHIAGRNIGFITPAAFLQFIPIVSNARMSGRAMVVVYLAVAMLAAMGVAELRTRRARAGLI